VIKNTISLQSLVVYLNNALEAAGQSVRITGIHREYESSQFLLRLGVYRTPIDKAMGTEPELRDEAVHRKDFTP
jgi:hypothetical protein